MDFIEAQRRIAQIVKARCGVDLQGMQVSEALPRVAEVMEWLHNYVPEADLVTPPAPEAPCECGGEKSGTGHSAWCPRFE